MNIDKETSNLNVICEGIYVYMCVYMHTVHMKKIKWMLNTNFRIVVTTDGGNIMSLKRDIQGA